MKRFQVSVDFENAEDVRRGRRIAHSVESEGRARDSLQLRAFVQPQEAGHLAGLQEVERVRPGRGGRPVALHALQLLRPLAAGHHIQLHILRLLLIEQHLAEQEVDARFLHSEGALFLVVPHRFTHIQRPLLPTLYHATFPHLLRGDFGDLKMRRRFLSISIPPSHRPPISLHSLPHQQLSLLQYELNNGLPLCIDLLQSVLQDLEGLRQVPRLSPSPRRKQRAARGQRQSHQGQRSPDDPQLAHSPPLQNPMHIGADCTATRRRRPSEIPASTPFQQSMKCLQMHFCPNVHFGKRDARADSLQRTPTAF